MPNSINPDKAVEVIEDNDQLTKLFGALFKELASNLEDAAPTDGNLEEGAFMDKIMSAFDPAQNPLLSKMANNTVVSNLLMSMGLADSSGKVSGKSMVDGFVKNIKGGNIGGPLEDLISEVAPDTLELFNTVIQMASNFIMQEEPTLDQMIEEAVLELLEGEEQEQEQETQQADSKVLAALKVLAAAAQASVEKIKASEKQIKAAFQTIANSGIPEAIENAAALKQAIEKKAQDKGPPDESACDVAQKTADNTNLSEDVKRFKIKLIKKYIKIDKNRLSDSTTLRAFICTVGDYLIHKDQLIGDKLTAADGKALLEKAEAVDLGNGTEITPVEYAAAWMKTSATSPKYGEKMADDAKAKLIAQAKANSVIKKLAGDDAEDAVNEAAKLIFGEEQPGEAGGQPQSPDAIAAQITTDNENAPKDEAGFPNPFPWVIKADETEFGIISIEKEAEAFKVTYSSPQSKENETSVKSFTSDELVKAVKEGVITKATEAEQETGEELDITAAKAKYGELLKPLKDPEDIKAVLMFLQYAMNLEILKEAKASEVLKNILKISEEQYKQIFAKMDNENAGRVVSILKNPDRSKIVINAMKQTAAPDKEKTKDKVGPASRGLGKIHEQLLTSDKGIGSLPKFTGVPGGSRPNFYYPKTNLLREQGKILHDLYLHIRILLDLEEEEMAQHTLAYNRDNLGEPAAKEESPPAEEPATEPSTEESPPAEEPATEPAASGRRKDKLTEAKKIGPKEVEVQNIITLREYISETAETVKEYARWASEEGGERGSTKLYRKYSAELGGDAYMPKKVLYKVNLPNIVNLVNSFIARLEYETKQAPEEPMQEVDEEQEDSFDSIVDKVENVFNFVVGEGKQLTELIKGYTGDHSDPNIPKAILVSGNKIHDQLESIKEYFPLTNPFKTKLYGTKGFEEALRVVENMLKSINTIAGQVSQYEKFAAMPNATKVNFLKVLNQMYDDIQRTFAGTFDKRPSYNDETSEEDFKKATVTGDIDDDESPAAEEDEELSQEELSEIEQYLKESEPFYEKLKGIYSKVEGGEKLKDLFKESTEEEPEISPKVDITPKQFLQDMETKIGELEAKIKDPELADNVVQFRKVRSLYLAYIKRYIESFESFKEKKFGDILSSRTPEQDAIDSLRNKEVKELYRAKVDYEGLFDLLNHLVIEYKKGTEANSKLMTSLITVVSKTRAGMTAGLAKSLRAKLKTMHKNELTTQQKEFTKQMTPINKTNNTKTALADTTETRVAPSIEVAPPEEQAPELEEVDQPEKESQKQIPRIIQAINEFLTQYVTVKNFMDNIFDFEKTINEQTTIIAQKARELKQNAKAIATLFKTNVVAIQKIFSTGDAPATEPAADFSELQKKYIKKIKLLEELKKRIEDMSPEDFTEFISETGAFKAYKEDIFKESLLREDDDLKRQLLGHIEQLLQAYTAASEDPAKVEEFEKLWTDSPLRTFSATAPATTPTATEKDDKAQIDTVDKWIADNKTNIEAGKYNFITYKGGEEQAKGELKSVTKEESTIPDRYPRYKISFITSPNEINPHEMTPISHTDAYETFVTKTSKLFKYEEKEQDPQAWSFKGEQQNQKRAEEIIAGWDHNWPDTPGQKEAVTGLVAAMLEKQIISETIRSLMELRILTEDDLGWLPPIAAGLEQQVLEKYVNPNWIGMLKQWLREDDNKALIQNLKGSGSASKEEPQDQPVSQDAPEEEAKQKVEEWSGKASSTGAEWQAKNDEWHKITSIEWTEGEESPVALQLVGNDTLKYGIDITADKFLEHLNDGKIREPAASDESDPQTSASDGDFTPTETAPAANYDRHITPEAKKHKAAVEAFDPEYHNLIYKLIDVVNGDHHKIKAKTSQSMQENKPVPISFLDSSAKLRGHKDTLETFLKNFPYFNRVRQVPDHYWKVLTRKELQLLNNEFREDTKKYEALVNSLKNPPSVEVPKAPKKKALKPTPATPKAKKKNKSRLYRGDPDNIPAFQEEQVIEKLTPLINKYLRELNG